MLVHPFKEKQDKIVQLIIFALVLIEVYQLYVAYSPQNIPWDTQHSYLPAAQHLLEQGLAFFTTEESLRYPPLTYIYYLPFLENLDIVRVLNYLFAISSLWFIYQTILQFSTAWHAVVGLLIYVTIPNLSTHWAALLTEPSFLFLTTIWLWATVKALTSNKNRFVVMAMTALALALMTRAVYIYFLYFILFSGTLWLFLGKKLPHKEAVKKILIICIGAIIPVWLFMLKNWIYFDLFTISNGMSGALYQGLHPFFGGTAPPFYGNNYDINAITADHLSIVAENRNMMASKVFITERSIGEHISFLINKLYLVFLDYQTPISRYWRLGLLPFFIYGLWVARPRKQQTLESLIFFFIGLLLIYQFAILLPILVLERYTVAGTAIPMSICGGYVYMKILQTATRKHIISLHIIAFLLILSGYAEIQQYKQYWPRLNPKAHVKAPTLTKGKLEDSETETILVKDNSIKIRSEAAYLSIPIKDISLNSKNAVIFLNLNVKAGSCKNAQSLATYSDQNLTTPLFTRKFILEEGKNQIRFGFFSRPKQTQLNIILTFYCDIKTQIQYEGINGYYDITPSYIINKILSKEN